ncbi:hypothetical protein Vadar_032896 [Vaccinium darrowii]|uniref:Uncharacterized protein n=1 Tax=Vaccinium darrowii TaxID=229202 RepID=A0ACB7Z8L3_9ERIC|nr:hypothetical protein Vadar_032896 [Vaccinium darrowii]
MHSGVDDVDIDMGMQKVTITGWADKKKVLKTVRKTGRRAELWQFPNNTNHQYFDHNITNHYYNHHHLHGGSATHYAPQPPSSSYNYYKHGYDYGHNPTDLHGHSHSTVFGNQTGSAFSDENPHGCSVM